MGKLPIQTGSSVNSCTYVVVKVYTAPTAFPCQNDHRLLYFRKWVPFPQTKFTISNRFIGFNYIADSYLPELPHIGSCAVTEKAIAVGIGISASYFFFLKFKWLGRLSASS